MTYRFPGMVGFVVRDGVPPSFASKITNDWFVSRAADALAQVGEARPEHRAGIMGSAYEARQALANAIATVDAAIAEVEGHCFPKDETTDPTENTQEPTGPPSAATTEPETDLGASSEPASDSSGPETTEGNKPRAPGAKKSKS